MTAHFIRPRSPARTVCCSTERCMSKNRTSPLLIAFRKSLSDWYGVRNEIAFARASSPSIEGPVEAPVTTPILNGRPALCSATALRAMARGTALAAPAAVKAENPTTSPSLIIDAISSAVLTGNRSAPEK
eukprot:Amastigsp_a178036_23.p3 type:complete len:130 gc:universal Amastigsp_a178036_23:1408-1797(+)